MATAPHDGPGLSTNSPAVSTTRDLRHGQDVAVFTRRVMLTAPRRTTEAGVEASPVSTSSLCASADVDWRPDAHAAVCS